MFSNVPPPYPHTCKLLEDRTKRPQNFSCYLSILRHEEQLKGQIKSYRTPIIQMLPSRRWHFSETAGGRECYPRPALPLSLLFLKPSPSPLQSLTLTALFPGPFPFCLGPGLALGSDVGGHLRGLCTSSCNTPSSRCCPHHTSSLCRSWATQTARHWGIRGIRSVCLQLCCIDISGSLQV